MLLITGPTRNRRLPILMLLVPGGVLMRRGEVMVRIVRTVM